MKYYSITMKWAIDFVPDMRDAIVRHIKALDIEWSDDGVLGKPWIDLDHIDDELTVHVTLRADLDLIVNWYAFSCAVVTDLTITTEEG